MRRLRGRWWILEAAALLIAVAVWWFFFWRPGQQHEDTARDAFRAYAADQPAALREGVDVVSHEGSNYLVCSRRSETAGGVEHLCMSIHVDAPEGRRVAGGYRVRSIGLELPNGTKTDCFGNQTGECV
jgi:hypothetical protein